MLRHLTARRWPLPALLIALTTLAALPILTYPMWRDHATYALIGRSILEGGRPYIDVWDIKPPAIYYLFALAIRLFGPGEGAVRMLDLLAVPGISLGLYALAQDISGRRAAQLAMLIFPVFYFTETFATLTQNDSLVLLPMTLAALCVLRAGQQPQDTRAALRWSGLAGLLCAVVLLFKHHFVFFVLALAAAHLLRRRALPLREGLAFAGGGLLFGLPVLAWLAASGILQEMLIVAQGTAAYTGSGAEAGAYIEALAGYGVFRWLHWGPLLVLAALWPFVTRREGRGLLLLWLAGVAAFLLVQAKFFDTHWLPLLPPLALLAAAALDAVLQRLARPRLTPLLYGLAGALLLALLLRAVWGPALAYISGQETQAEYYARFQGNDYKPAQSLEIIRYLQENAAAGDTLFIWGFRPEIYYVGGYRPPTRFISHFPLVGDRYPQEWQQETVDLLWAALPPFVLVLQSDYMPWVTGSDDDSHTLLQDYTELNNWLIFNYRFETEMGDFLIWRRAS